MSPRRYYRVVAASVVVVSGLAASLTLGATAASAGGPCGSGYGYSGYGGKTDPNGFFAPDMRSYVAECLNTTGSDFARTEKGPNGSTAIFGEPSTWDATANSLGFAVTAVPAVGLVAQLHSGETAPLYDAQGKPAGTLRGGDVVGYVDAVYAGSQVLMRTYDSSTHAVRSIRMTAPRYLRLSGGTGVRGTPTPSKSPTPSPSPKATPTPTPKATPTPAASVSPTPVATLTPTAAPATTAPVVVANPPAKTSKSLASRYGKWIGIGGVAIAAILGIIVIIASRRTDDIGD